METWENCTVEGKADLLAYNEIRVHEETEEQIALMKACGASIKRLF